jgi:2-octaprenyl-6-methoxyphenol hydroxylase
MTSSALSSSNDYDVIICGAGPVGLSVATLLQRCSNITGAAVRIALLDAKPAAAASHDPRTLALSHGSQQILHNLGAWPLMAAGATPIHDIHVSRRQHFGRTLIRSDDYHLPALGYVVRYGPLVTALSEALSSATMNSTLTIVRPAQVVGIEEHNSHVNVQLADGGQFSAGLVVQAEGGVFAEQAARPRQRDYQQIAIIAHVHSSHPVAHRAFERFTAEGPLALLPQDNGYALVWCARPATAARLLALDDEDFLKELGTTFGTRLGRFIATSSRHSYALGLNAASQTTTARTVSIGNAAQTLHPVAGQGLNLGLRDAMVLSSQLIQHGCNADALAQFSQRHRNDRNATIRMTDLMARVFASAADGSLSQTLLGISLSLIDIAAPVKRALAEQMVFGRR